MPIVNEAIDEVTKRYYASYAEFVNLKGRTVAYVKDTLKLPQRRVLMAAYDLTKNGSFAKSAKIVGHVIGSYHPHGDCVFEGEKFFLLNGTTMTIKEAYDKQEDLEILAWDSQNNKLRRATAHSFRIGQYAERTFRVYLQNKSFECTSNHPVCVLRNSGVEWVAAESLVVGDRLLMGAKYTTPDGFVRVLLNNQKGNLLHTLDTPRVPSCHVTHHIDGNRSNNSLSNLAIISRSDHAKLHSDSDKDFRTTQLEALAAGRNTMFNGDNEFTQKIKQKNTGLMNEYNKICNLHKAVRILDIVRKNNEEVSVESYNKYRPSIYNGPKLSSVERLYGVTFEQLAMLTVEDVLAMQKKVKVEKQETLGSKSSKKQIIRKQLTNDTFTITDIKIIDHPEPIPMYDFTVDDYHNAAFVVGEDETTQHLIFLHNSSAYETMVNMVRNGYIDGQGCFGINVGLDECEAAAYRYTEARVSSIIKEIAFKYVQFVPYYKNDLENDEPTYFPTMLPLNLIQFSKHSELVSAIGVGLRYTLPQFPLKDAIKYMQVLIESGKPDYRKLPLVYKTIKRPCTSTLASKGKDKVEFTGLYTIGKNGKNMIITEFPPEKNAADTARRMGDVTDGSKTTTEIHVKFPWGKSSDDFEIDKLLTSTVNLDLMFHNMTMIRNYSLSEVFLTVYEGYKEAVMESFNQEKIRIQNRIHIYDDLIKIRPFLNPLDKGTLARVVAGANLGPENAKKLMSYSLDTIANAEAKKAEDKKSLKSIQDQVDHIDEVCYNQYDAIKS